MRNNRIAVIIGSVIMVIVLAAAGLKIYLNRPLPAIVMPPPPAMPADNGFDDCLRAVSLLKDADSAAELSPDQRREARALLESNREAMQTVRQALGKAYMNPRPKRWDEELPHLKGFRQIANLFRLEGDVKASRGDYRGAAESFLDARRFGAIVPTGGWLVHWALGLYISSRGYIGLEEISGKLDVDTCRHVLRELQAAGIREPLLRQAVDGEEIYGLMVLLDMRQGKSKGPNGRPDAPMPPLIDRLMGGGRASVDGFQTQMRLFSAESSKPFYLRKPLPEPRGIWTGLLVPAPEMLTKKSMASTRAQIVKLMIALRLYHLEHGSYPGALADLKPSSLIIMDEFTGKPLVYKPASDGYLLYSVGPDGKDDGGTPLKKAKNESLGDIVAGKLFPAREDAPK